MRNKSTSITTSTGVGGYSQKINLDKEPVRLESVGGRRSRRSGGKEFNLQSGLRSFAFTILCISLLGTMFFAYQNQVKDDISQFTFFSPSQYLERISSSKFVPAGSYYVKKEGFGTASCRAVIEYNGVVFHSVNSYPSYLVMTQLEDGYKDYIVPSSLYQFEFVIGGVSYLTESGTVPISNALGDVDMPTLILNVKESVSVDVAIAPSYEDIADTWKEVNNILDVLPAINSTAMFVADTVSYYTNLVTNLMPWNATKSSENVNVDIPWRDDVNEYVSP